MSFFLGSVVNKLDAVTRTRSLRRDLHPIWVRAVLRHKLRRSLQTDRAEYVETDEWTEETLIKAAAHYGLLERILLWEYITIAVPDEHTSFLFPKWDKTILHNIARTAAFQTYAVAAVLHNLDPDANPNPRLGLHNVTEGVYPDGKQIEASERVRYPFPWLDESYQPFEQTENDITKGHAKALWDLSSALFSFGPVARITILRFLTFYQYQRVRDLHAELVRHTKKPDDDLSFRRITINTDAGLGNALYYNTEIPGARDDLLALFTKYRVIVLLYMSIIVRTVILSFAYSPRATLDVSESMKDKDHVHAGLLSDLYSGSAPENFEVVDNEYIDEYMPLTDEQELVGADTAWNIREALRSENKMTSDDRVEFTTTHAYSIMQHWSEFTGNFDDVMFGTYQLKLAAVRLGLSDKHVVPVETPRVGAPMQQAVLNTSLVVHIRINRIDLRPNQSKPQFMLWTSHGLTNPIQDVSMSTDDSAPGLFMKRMAQSGAVITPAFDPVQGTVVTVRIHMHPGARNVSPQIKDRAALCVALYVQQQDFDDAVAITRRRGLGFALLKEFEAIQGEDKHVSLRLWEGPIKADYTIDPETYRTDKPMQFFKSCAVDMLVENLPLLRGERVTSRKSTGVVFAGTSGLDVGASAPRSLVPGKDYELHINKFVLKTLEEYARTGDSPAYHSLMLLLWPGTPTYRILALESRIAAHAIGFYETLLRHQLWRDNVADDEFVRIFDIAYAENHAYRMFAHERVWWIITMALSFVNICMYKLDVLEQRNVEIMENITIAMAGDCEDDSLALYHAVERLKILPLSDWEPLRLVQIVLKHMVPFQMVMTTAAASLSSVGTAGPMLHSTCILIPVWQVHPEVPVQVGPHVMAIEKARILEGTGIYAGWVASIWHCFGTHKNIPDVVLRTIEQYNTLRSFLVKDAPFDAPTVGETSAGSSPYHLAENHPFFGHCVSLCGRSIEHGDKLLLFHTVEEKGGHRYPHFSLVLSGDTDKYTFRSGPGRDVDLAKYAYIKDYFPPAPFFDGKPLPLDVQTETALRQMPMKHVQLAHTGHQPHKGQDGDAELLRFKACTVFMNAKASANPAAVMKKRLDAFMKTRLGRDVASVDWKVVQYMYGVVQYEIRVTY